MSPSITSYKQIWKDDFPFEIVWSNLNLDYFPTHSHSFHELVVVLGGQGVHVCDGRSYHISTGDVFLLQGPQQHSYRDLKNMELVNISYQPDALLPQTAWLGSIPGYHAMFVLEPRCRQEQSYSNRLRLTGQDLETVRQSIHLMIAEYQDKPPGYKAFCQAKLLELIILLARVYSRKGDEPARGLLRVGELISMIERDYADDLKLADLAAKAHLSKNQLIRIFREATGKTPIEYLICFRINKAAELLHSTSMNVTEIALQCGFADGNYLSRRFRKQMGFSPRQYRNQR